MKPTKIIAEPVKKAEPGCQLKTWLIQCDDGQEYTLRTLSKAVKIDYHTLQARLSRYGWNHPDIFADAGAFLTHRATGRKPDISKSPLSHLSIKSRYKNLAKIKIGIWEGRK